MRIQPFRVVISLGWLVCVCLVAGAAAQDNRETPAHSARLQSVVDNAVQSTLTHFAGQKLQTNQLAVTLVDLRDPLHPVQASYRGDAQVYPASVVKLFYLVAAHRWMEDGKIEDTEELRRAMKDMIVDSYNEATHYVVDVLTGTTSGPELPRAELDEWFEKRNAVNRHFAALGYTNINANKKPWCEGPYGREMQSIKIQKPNRNMLTTDATARLLSEIVTDKSVSPTRSAEMRKLLQRDPAKKSPGTEEPDQSADFTAPALPPGAKLWSKAGWTSETRHDAACVELPNGARFVLVTFTVGHANEREIIPALARAIVSALASDRK
jgi:beta-lactamase class A